jgi:flagellar basal body rod protein FlgG
VIDPSLAAALTRVADRAYDALHGYSAAFQPKSSDVARRIPQLLPDAGPLSTSAPSDAYFIVTDRKRLLLTRDGAMRFDDGVLRAADGAAVLGQKVDGGPSGHLIPLRVDPVDAALRRPRDPRIGPDGIVTFMQTSIDPRTSVRREERVALGRVALARFPAGTQPLRVDDKLVEPPKGVVPQIGHPADGNFGPLRTNVRELGNVDLEAALRRLQEAYVSLEALQNAGRARKDLEKGAMDLLK